MPRKSQFTDEQIIRALREVDAGAKPADVCRRLGVTETFYRWKSKFGQNQTGVDFVEACVASRPKTGRHLVRRT